MFNNFVLPSTNLFMNCKSFEEEQPKFMIRSMNINFFIIYKFINKKFDK